MSAEKKLSTVLTIAGDEIKKRPKPLSEIDLFRSPSDFWAFAILIAFFIGCIVGHISVLIPLGE